MTLVVVLGVLNMVSGFTRAPIPLGGLWLLFLIMCQIALGIGGLVTLYPARDVRRRGMILGAVGIAFALGYLPVLTVLPGRLTALTLAGVEAVIAISLVRAWLLVRFSQGR